MAHLLLIEPDVKLTKVYAKAFKSTNHTLDIATSAQSAIHASDNRKPDIVILELQLADHNGIEFLYEFRSYSEWESIPVVVLSRISPNEFRNNAVLKTELGVIDYLYKPRTSIKTLINSIDSLLNPVL